MSQSLRVIDGLAEFCKAHKNVVGLELVNEPRADVPLNFLRRFYEDAYLRVRKHLSPERAAVVFHDGFRSLQWKDFMQDDKHRNVLLDTHFYQCFSEDDARRDVNGQVALAVADRKIELDMIRQRHRCIVGEWSCGLPRKSLARSAYGLDLAMRAYGSAQLLSYESAEGWFFLDVPDGKRFGLEFSRLRRARLVAGKIRRLIFQPALQMDDAALNRGGDGFGAVGDAKFAQDIF